jgi:hypothetical protein
MDREHFADLYRELCTTASNDLYAYGLKLFDAMTDDEREPFATQEYRLPKAVLVAITDDGRVNDQFNAETIKPTIKRLRKIIKARYV